MSELIYTDYSKKGLLVSLIIVILIIAISYFLFPSSQDLLCRELKSIEAREIEGIVQRVYIDKEEHLNEIVEFTEAETGREKMLVLSLDRSKLFDVLRPGDKINKKKGSLMVNVNNNTSFQIDYGVQCEND